MYPPRPTPPAPAVWTATSFGARNAGVPICVLQCVTVSCRVLVLLVCSSMLQCVASVLQYVRRCWKRRRADLRVAVCHNVLQSVSVLLVCSSMLQSIAVCPSLLETSAFQSACCSVLQGVAGCCRVSQCVLVCYSVLQMRCNMLQCVAVCRSVCCSISIGARNAGMPICMLQGIAGSCTVLQVCCKCVASVLKMCCTCVANVL